MCICIVEGEMMRPKKYISWAEYGKLADCVMRDERLVPLAKVLILAIAHELSMGDGPIKWSRIEEITGAKRGQLYWAESMVGRNEAYKSKSPIHCAVECGYLTWKQGSGPFDMAVFRGCS